VREFVRDGESYFYVTLFAVTTAVAGFTVSLSFHHLVLMRVRDRYMIGLSMVNAVS
jgi:hypothetical protein